MKKNCSLIFKQRINGPQALWGQKENKFSQETEAGPIVLQSLIWISVADIRISFISFIVTLSSYFACLYIIEVSKLNDYRLYLRDNIIQ